MVNRVTRTVLFAASALFSMSAFGAGAARFGTLRNSDWVVTNAWQAVSNKTHDLILEIGQGDSLPPDWQNVSNAAMNAVQSLQPSYDYTDNELISFSSTGSVFRSLSYGTTNYWTDSTGCVWKVGAASGIGYNEWTCIVMPQGYSFLGIDTYSNQLGIWRLDLYNESNSNIDSFYTTGDENPQYLLFDVSGIMVEAIPNVTVTKLVGRVALTNDISQAISTNNSAFVSAVLSAPLVGANPNDLSEIAEYGTYGTVGAAILALIAGLAALKRGKLDGAAAYPAWVDAAIYGNIGTVVSHKGRLWKNTEPVTSKEPGASGVTEWTQVYLEDLKQDALSSNQLAAVNSGATAAKVATWDGYAAQIAQKANADALPYALVTPGEWTFSGLPSGYEVTSFQWLDVVGDDTGWEYEISDIGGGSFVGVVAGTETDLSVTVSISLIGVTFTATRASLPGKLLDRANNLIDATTGDVTLTLPAYQEGKVRDLLVHVNLGDDGTNPYTVTFNFPSGETNTGFKVKGNASAPIPAPDAAGEWLFSFSECAPHKMAVSLAQLQDATVAGGS